MNVKRYYEPNIFSIGYLGEFYEEGDCYTDCYKKWYGIMRRSYSEYYHFLYPTYNNIKTSKEFENFSNFKLWYNKNYYSIPNEKMCLDKDILIKGNNVYSSETCVFVPEKINLIFTTRVKHRGDLPLGVTYHKDKYYSQCNIYNKRVSLGYHDSPIEAWLEYKYYKELYIKEVADKYMNKYPQLFPKNLYNALYEWEVEIND